MTVARRVLVVEDHALVGHGLVALIRRAGLDAESMTGSALAAGRAGGVPAADVVVLDLDLDGGVDGVDWVAPFVSAGAAVLVCTGAVDRARLGRCLELGAAAVFPKTRSTEQLVAAVLDVLAGGSPMRPGDRSELLAAARTHRAMVEGRLRAFASLTPREADVLSGMVAGLAPAVMAQGAGVSVKTVRNQIETVLQKLGVRSQLQAAAVAREAGWQPGLRLGLN